MWVPHGGEKRLETNDGKWKKIEEEKLNNTANVEFGDDFYCEHSNMCSV